MANIDISFSVDCSVLAEVPDEIMNDPEEFAQWIEEYVKNLSDKEIISSLLLEDSDNIMIHGAVDADTCEWIGTN
jgi:hypothetical protein